MTLPNMEKFFQGQYSLTPEEIEKAKMEGKLDEKQKKMEKATKSLRTKQAEEAIKQIEEDLQNHKAV